MSMRLDGLLMCRRRIILAVMLCGAAMRFGSGIMLFSGLGMMIMGHRISDR